MSSPLWEKQDEKTIEFLNFIDEVDRNSPRINRNRAKIKKLSEKDKLYSREKKTQNKPFKELLKKGV